MKSGNLKFLEPSGPPQACKGTALPFFMYTKLMRIISADFNAADLTTDHVLLIVTCHLLTYAGNIYWVKTTNKSYVYEEIKS
jgi:hypothetical protein